MIARGDSPFVWFLVGTLLTITFLVSFLKSRRDRARVRALAALARSLSLRFQESGFPSVPNYAPFQQRHSPRVANTFSGKWQGRDLVMGDFRYSTVTSGKYGNSYHGHEFSYIFLPLPDPGRNCRSKGASGRRHASRHRRSWRAKR